MKLRQDQRGSTLIMVLALLSILIFLAAALAYTSRLEKITSGNFARATQARIAAATGLPQALALARPAFNLTTTLQPWRQAALDQNLAADSTKKTASSGRAYPAFTNTSTGQTSNTQDGGQPQPSAVQISDLCARVNINTVSNPQAFERFLSALYASGNPNTIASVSKLRAQAMIAYRIADSRAAAAVLTTTTPEADLRKLPPDGTRYFYSLGELSHIMGGVKLFGSEDEIKALNNYITVFSQSPEMFNISDEYAVPKHPVAEMEVNRLLDVLKRAFPEKDPRLLMQFAVNAADYADPDDVPAVMTDPQHPEPWNVIIGCERTPLISEVYPDSVTYKDGRDDGQYVEIYNPWDKVMVLRNWRLAIAGGIYGSPGIGSVVINTEIPPDGHIILTDNYDHPQTDDSADSGCFLSIFGARKDDGKRKLIETAALNLPDKNSFVALLDAEGHLIDVFSYTSAAAPNSKISYQRDDPRVRSFSVAQATPFEKPPKGICTAPPLMENAVRQAWKNGNAPLASPADLFKVSTAYAGLRQSDGATVYDTHPWQAPEYATTPENKTTNLDARILDAFTAVSRSDARETTLPASAQRASQRRTMDTKTDTTQSKDQATSSGVLYAYGRLNLNTCPKFALLSLDTGDANLALTQDFIDKFEAYRLAKLASGRPPFRNISEFFTKFFPNPDEKQMKVIEKLLNQVTVSSSSFEIIAENRLPKEDSASKSKNTKTAGRESPPRARLKWTVALDREPFSLIGYNIEP
ncbi:MAG: hypothetical protein WCK47_03075 [bacterium]